MNKFNLEQVKNQLKDFLPQYLSEHGYEIKKQFKCISPQHTDSHPSAGIIKNNPRFFHCLSCGFTGDLLDAASILEGLPGEGPLWYSQTFKPLCERYGISIPEIKLTEEEIKKHEIFRAYFHAYSIIKISKRSEIVSNKLNIYGWSPAILDGFGIGSVVSYSDYIDRMTKTYGHKLDFLKKIDLANINIFNESNLIYTIKDEDGNPVGFTARDLKYEEKIKDYEINPNGVYKPNKYFNTNGEKNPYFIKSRILFNFDKAKKLKSSIFVFEGQPDCVTATAGGLRNATCIGSTFFTKDHLQLCIANDINHIIFILDSDKAGKNGTDKFIEFSQECAGTVGLKIEATFVPAGKDPDEFIRNFPDMESGVKALRELPRIDAFSWKLSKSISEGQDPIVLCESALPLICNEPNNLLRFQMADKLANVTGIDPQFVRKELLRLIDEKSANIEENKNIIASEIANLLKKSPNNIENILLEASTKLENIQKKNIGYDISNLMKSLDYVFDRQINQIDKIELKTGFPILDETLGGIPKSGCLGSVPGKGHHGKALTLNSKLKTPYNWVLMKDIKIGDKLASIDGKESIVTGIFPQGKEKIYRITFSDGRFVNCSSGHLWNIKFVNPWIESQSDSNFHNDWHTFTTDAIKTFCLNGNRKNNHNSVYIPLVEGSFGSNDKLLIDPYLLGILIGDGCIKYNVSFNSTDTYVINKISNIIMRDYPELSVRYKGNYSYDITGIHNNNKLMEDLRKLNLFGKGSYPKFIPKEYLESNLENRWSLLQGLMDTDGIVNKDSQIQYCTISPELSKNVQYLIRSLGGLCSISVKSDAYILFICMPDRQPRLTISSIEEIGFEETQCITVSHASKLFITNDFIVTHNSIVLDNLIVNLNSNNTDNIVLLHSVDDHKLQRLPRILGCKYNLPSNLFVKAGYYLDGAGKYEYPTFAETYYEARHWLKKQLEEEKILIADTSDLPQDMSALKTWIKSIKNRYPNRTITVFGDNFHLYDLSDGESGESKYRSLSKYASGIVNELGVSCFFTMEIPQDVLKPGIRPSYLRIKNTSGISYDAKLNIGIYQEMQDFNGASNLYWEDNSEIIKVQDSDGLESMIPLKRPIVELIIDKNKINGIKKTIFMKLNPDSGKMIECTEIESNYYKSKIKSFEEKSFKQFK